MKSKENSVVAFLLPYCKTSSPTPKKRYKVKKGIVPKIEAKPQGKEIKLKKDGTPKKIVHNKKKGKSSEVFPIQIPDIKKILHYFEINEKWECYLIFVFSCNMARRIGDTLSLTWEHIYYSDGQMRDDLLEIAEDKTDKLASPHLNSACKAAIQLYIEKTHVNPASKDYKNPIFIQSSGKYAGRVITADGYRKALKRAADAVGIKYNVGTHSPRKTFGMVTRMLHPNDRDSMELLRNIFNHSDTKTTEHYIGLTKEKVNKFYDDMGEFFDGYVTGDKVYNATSESPVVYLESHDLREIIKEAYRMGAENAENIDPVIHINAMNEIMKMVDKLKK